MVRREERQGEGGEAHNDDGRGAGRAVCHCGRLNLAAFRVRKVGFQYLPPHHAIQQPPPHTHIIINDGLTILSFFLLSYIPSSLSDVILFFFILGVLAACLWR